MPGFACLGKVPEKRGLNALCRHVNSFGFVAFFPVATAILRLWHKGRTLMIMVRKLALAAALGVTGFGAGFSPSVSARVVVGVDLSLPIYAPPAPIVERVAVRPGYVWIPGYWRWGGVRYVWVGGNWSHARIGYHYAPARWIGCGRHWCYHRGYWHR